MQTCQQRLKDTAQISNVAIRPVYDAIRIRIGVGRDNIVGGPTVSSPASDTRVAGAEGESRGKTHQ